MELIQGSETSANYILTPGIYAKDHIHYSNHGESLKSKKIMENFKKSALQSDLFIYLYFTFHGSFGVNPI
jgi:hypothetical protein